MKKLNLFILMLSLFALSGCAMLAVKEDDLGAELVVKAATAEYLRANPGYAEPVADITTAAMAGISYGKIISVDQLDSFVRAKANLDSLTPESQLLTDMLVKRVKAALIKHLSAQGITDPGAAMVQARIVIGWVNETARVYARHQEVYP